MPRQTSATPMQTIFPDGFRFEVSNDSGSTWSDMGVLVGGANITYNWDEMYLDGGNYEGFVDKIINPSIALAPSALWNFDTTKLAVVFGGIFSSAAATSPDTGNDLTYAGTSNNVSLTRVSVRLTHYDVDASGGTELDTDIDWQFTLHHAKVDAGASFNMKGVGEDGLSEVSISFTGKPDPASTYQLFTFFKAS